ncbi:hypothetical protein GCM10017771_34990 [Streptomyces capitiformicae]|uniref:Uncharacterized protein n=1 Tax=Streptomyces capitiformicae TaxID=2014920 RepID=A0A919L998_9ACTN|nr:hypothetical protein GCM10017771_34990 [Streptomyces capitiformicae]
MDRRHPPREAGDGRGGDRRRRAPAAAHDLHAPDKPHVIHASPSIHGTHPKLSRHERTARPRPRPYHRSIHAPYIHQFRDAGTAHNP